MKVDFSIILGLENAAELGGFLLPQSVQVALDGPGDRMIRANVVQVRSIGVTQQIARFLQLPEILEHQPQIRSPDGDGGMHGLKRLLSGSQRLAIQYGFTDVEVFD